MQFQDFVLLQMGVTVFMRFLSVCVCVTANIAGSGSLSKLPLVPQQSGGGALNLKLSNPVNIRMANPVALNPTTRGTAVLGTRPAMVLNQGPIRAGGPSNQVMAQNFQPLGSPALTQIPTQAFAQVMPGSTQLLPQGMQFPQGARLVTQLPIAQIGDACGVTGNGRLPMRAQVPNIRPGGPVSSMPLITSCAPMITASGNQTPTLASPVSMVTGPNLVQPLPLSNCTLLPTGQPMVAFPPNTTITPVSQTCVISTQPQALTMAPNSTVPAGSAANRKNGPSPGTGISSKLSHSGPMPIAPKPPKEITQPDSTSKGESEPEMSSRGEDKVEKLKKGEENTQPNSPSDDKNTPQESGSCPKSTEPKDNLVSEDFDPSQAMEWNNDGIGVLPGSSLKVR